MIDLIKNKLSFNLKTKGFAIVELLVVSFIISVAFFAITGASQRSLSLSIKALQMTQASFVLEEGVEAIKTIRDTDWTNITSLTYDTPYYLSFSNGIWILSTTPSTGGSFTRTVQFKQVYRDGSDRIADTGTPDNKTYLVDVIVSWSSAGVTVSKNISFYIS